MKQKTEKFYHSKEVKIMKYILFLAILISSCSKKDEIDFKIFSTSKSSNLQLSEISFTNNDIVSVYKTKYLPIQNSECGTSMISQATNHKKQVVVKKEDRPQYYEINLTEDSYIHAIKKLNQMYKSSKDCHMQANLLYNKNNYTGLLYIDEYNLFNRFYIITNLEKNTP